MARREVLFFASYCGGDNPACTDAAPCSDCLAMCSVFEVEMGGAVYVRQLAPDREESDAWKSKLARLLRPLAGARPLSRTRFDAMARLAGASRLIGRRKAPVAQQVKGR